MPDFSFNASRVKSVECQFEEFLMTFQYLHFEQSFFSQESEKIQFSLQIGERKYFVDCFVMWKSNLFLGILIVWRLSKSDESRSALTLLWKYGEEIENY